MTIIEQCISKYAELKNLKLVGEAVGIPWQTVYVHLRKAGVQVTGDKARYGSDKDRLASKGENLFQSIVPFAKNQNNIEFQSKVDFIVGNQKIDIKTSTLKKGLKHSNSRRWAFSVKKQELIADFMVLFAFHDDESYEIFLIPCELIKNYQSISISEKAKNNSKWGDYIISSQELFDFFSEYNNTIQ